MTNTSASVDWTRQIQSVRLLPILSEDGLMIASTVMVLGAHPWSELTHRSAVLAYTSSHSQKVLGPSLFL